MTAATKRAWDVVVTPISEELPPYPHGNVTTAAEDGQSRLDKCACKLKIYQKYVDRKTTLKKAWL